MRVLWIKAGGIAPLDTGGKIRSFHILQELARRHEVTLFTFYPAMPDDPHPGLRSMFADAVLVPLPIPRRGSAANVWQYLRVLCSGQPYTIARFHKPGLRDLARHMFTRGWDAVVCDFLVPAPLMDWNLDAVKVLFTHNVEAQVWRRHSRVASNPFWKVAGYLEYRKLARIEPKYAKLADHVLAVSEPDRQHFASYVDPARTSVVPTGVDSDYFHPAPEEEQPNSIVFTGSMDWMPNDDGVAWFAAEILPLVRAEIPGVQVWVVGRNPAARIQALEARGSGIHVTGRVDDIRPYLNQGAVYIVPLRSGSGTRLKIFEAMAAGKAVVSTAIGAEGLPVEDGKDIAMADEPCAFAAHIVRLLRDDGERRRLGAAARALIDNGHSWAAVGAHFEALLAGLVEQRRREVTVCATP